MPQRSSSSHAGGSNSGQRIIDAHFHLWDLDENYYPWLSDGDRPSLIKDYSSLRRNYLVSDFLRDIGDLNVIAAVHIQAEHDHSDVVRETRWLQQVADRPTSRGFPQAIVADVDFARPDAERLLEGHCAFRNMRGIRHVLHRRLDGPLPYDPLENPAFLRNFSLLKTFGLSFDMQLFVQQAPAAARLVAANPDVQIVLTHAGMPPWGDPQRMPLWRDAIRTFAAFPNVVAKLSDWGTSNPHWDARSIDPVVSEVIAAFGIERCMLAGNYPVERLAKPYADVWATYLEYFASYSDAERDQVFWRTAASVYRIEVADA